jgi:hypothetical protein
MGLIFKIRPYKKIKTMKKFILSFLIITVLAVSPSVVLTTSADICVPTDPDYDAADCTTQGGTIGTPIGTPGGPGGANDVPIDGGLSIMLAVGGAISARKAFKNRKK